MCYLHVVLFKSVRSTNKCLLIHIFISVQLLIKGWMVFVEAVLCYCYVIVSYNFQEQFGHLSGLKLAWVGDGNNIVHSLMMGCTKLGIDLSVATPQVGMCVDVMECVGLLYIVEYSTHSVQWTFQCRFAI